ncbi:20887_t:CDS:2 [Entrophospora sp. SA101]|nr:20887_t:CDS:2 [Entrophospora sp. SA101]
MTETFIGGKNKNRHRDKKVPNSQGEGAKITQEQDQHCATLLLELGKIKNELNQSEAQQIKYINAIEEYQRRIDDEKLHKNRTNTMQIFCENWKK